MICPCLRQNYLFMHDLKRRYLSRFQNEINSRALDIQGLGSAHCNLTILMRRISNSETLQARLGGAGRWSGRGGAGRSRDRKIQGNYFSFAAPRATKTSIWHHSRFSFLAAGHKFEYYYLSNPKPGHTTGESGRGGARRSGAESGRMGRRRVGSPGVRHSYSPRHRTQLLCERLFRSTHKRNPMQTDGGTKKLLTTGSSAGRRPIFVPGC